MEAPAVVRGDDQSGRGVVNVASRAPNGRCKNMKVALDCHVRVGGAGLAELERRGSAS